MIWQLSKSSALAVVFLLGVALAAQGRDISKNAGTSAFSFLKINPGARAVGMGGAYTGMADDELSFYYNPAGLSSFEERHFVGDYMSYFADMQSGMIGLVTPVGLDRVIGFHISYLNYGDFTETDMSGNTLGDFGGGDILFGVSGAMRYKYDWQFGATVKFIYEKIKNYSATGLATDLGVRYTRNRGKMAFGAMVQNLGFQMSSLGDEKDKLPLTFRGGGAFEPTGLNITLAADVIVPIDNRPEIAIGGEYFELKPLYIRLGWNSFGTNYRTADSGDDWAGMGVGVGFDIKEFQISYAFAPGAELGDTHRITFTGGI